MRRLQRIVMTLAILFASAVCSELFAREYDPRLGRFLQRDPASAIEAIRAQYVYVSNLPTMNTDPHGLFEMAVHATMTKGLLMTEIKEIGAVVDANTGRDLDIAGYSPREHYDNDQILEGNRYVDEQYSIVSGRARGITPGKDKPANTPLEALQALGRLLHARQDFYSHSNYVELFLQSKFPGLDFSKMTGVTQADIKPYHFQGTPNFTVTGVVFDPNTGERRIRTRVDLVFEAHAGKVVTGWYGGLVAEATKAPAPPGKVAHWELNKDSNASGRGAVRLANGLNLHDFAEAAARRQTLEEFDRFKTEWNKNPRLLGIDMKKWSP